MTNTTGQLIVCGMVALYAVGLKIANDIKWKRYDERQRNKEKKMTNEEFIKSLNTKELAHFIANSSPSCNELCEDSCSGCAWGCKHNQGDDVIEKWLKEEV